MKFPIDIPLPLTLKVSQWIFLPPFHSKCTFYAVVLEELETGNHLFPDAFTCQIKILF